MNDWGRNDNWDVFVSTPGSDVLRAGFSENETALIFRIQFQDLDGPDATSRFLNFVTTFGFRNASAHAEQLGFKVNGVLVPFLPPLVGPPLRELDVLFYNDYGLEDYSTTTYRLESTVDYGTNTITSVIPKTNITTLASEARFNSTIGPGWELFDARIFAGQGLCVPAVVTWYCTGIGGSAQPISIDYAPQSGLDPVGRGKPFQLAWAISSPPTGATSERPAETSPPGSTPGFTVGALALVVGIAYRWVRRRHV